MAIPTSTIFVDPGKEFGMAAAAISFHHRSTALGDADGFGDAARMKSQGILDAIH